MKRTVPLPQSFGSCKVPLLLAVAAMTGHCGLRHRVENGGRWNISVLCPFTVSFSDPGAKLEGFSWSCLYLRPVPTASVWNSGQGIPEGKEMANSPLGWWYFESWSPPLCLILFTFQSPWRTVPCILSSCIQ